SSPPPSTTQLTPQRSLAPPPLPSPAAGTKAALALPRLHRRLSLPNRFTTTTRRRNKRCGSTRRLLSWPSWPSSSSTPPCPTPLPPLAPPPPGGLQPTHPDREGRSDPPLRSFFLIGIPSRSSLGSGSRVSTRVESDSASREVRSVLLGHDLPSLPP